MPPLPGRARLTSTRTSLPLPRRHDAPRNCPARCSACLTTRCSNIGGTIGRWNAELPVLKASYRTTVGDVGRMARLMKLARDALRAHPAKWLAARALRSMLPRMPDAEPSGGIYGRTQCRIAICSDVLGGRLSAIWSMLCASPFRRTTPGRFTMTASPDMHSPRLPSPRDHRGSSASSW